MIDQVNKNQSKSCLKRQSGLLSWFYDISFLYPLRTYGALLRCLYLSQNPTGLVVGGTGSTLYTTKHDFFHRHLFLAIIAVNTKVFGIVEGLFVIPVRETIA